MGQPVGTEFSGSFIVPTGFSGHKFIRKIAFHVLDLFCLERVSEVNAIEDGEVSGEIYIKTEGR